MFLFMSVSQLVSFLTLLILYIIQMVTVLKYSLSYLKLQVATTTAFDLIHENPEATVANFFNDSMGNAEIMERLLNHINVRFLFNDYACKKYRFHLR